MLGPALLVGRLVRLGEIDRVARVGQGRADDAAGLQHRLDAFVVEVVGVEDQIDAGARGIEGRLAAACMGDRLFAEAMGLAHHDFGLFLGEGGDEFAIRRAAGCRRARS